MSESPAHEASAVPSLPPAGIGVTTGTLLIVANMIGVGVFTTTGYMVGAIKSPIAVLVAWLVGGVAAFCGALSYAELGAALPRNGGEYQFLSRIYHPGVGFVSGLASLVVGFAAPLALFSMVFGTYLNGFLPAVPPLIWGLLLIGVFAVLHALHVGTGSKLHNVFTLGKVALIGAFILAGVVCGDMSRLTAASEQTVGAALRSPMFAVELVYVSFAYSGWNTAAYLAGEFLEPKRDIPRAVLGGTVIVALLYVGLNLVFLASAPLNEMANKEDVAQIAAKNLFGERGGRLVAFMIMAGLISTASSNIMAGPRVYEAMGLDYPSLTVLSVRRAGGGPVPAIALQTGLAAVMMLTASFDKLLKYVSVTLALFAGATVLGVLVLRFREPSLPRPYRTWGYPFTPILFVALEIWMIVFTVWDTPLTAAFSAGTIVAGLIVYAVVRPRS
jgi:APA family basic amino acid/polyamine antiporter